MENPPPFKDIPDLIQSLDWAEKGLLITLCNGPGGGIGRAAETLKEKGCLEQYGIASRLTVLGRMVGYALEKSLENAS